MNKTSLTLPPDYARWLTSLKQRIRGARQRALLAANDEQIRLYHDIGRDILDRQRQQGWGAKVIERLAADLRAAFPDMKGLSASNLKYMRFFAQECPDRLIGQQTADQLPWFHIVTLITKLSDPGLRDWYARAALEQSWPRDTLAIQIKNQLHLRQGAAVTNFDQRLIPPQAGLNPAASMKPSGIEWLGDVPAHWEVWKLAHAFAQIGSGTTPRTDNRAYYDDGEIPWINTGDLNDGDLA